MNAPAPLSAEAFLAQWGALNGATELQRPHLPSVTAADLNRLLGALDRSGQAAVFLVAAQADLLQERSWPPNRFAVQPSELLAARNAEQWLLDPDPDALGILRALLRNLLFRAEDAGRAAERFLLSCGPDSAHDDVQGLSRSWRDGMQQTVSAQERAPSETTFLRTALTADADETAVARCAFLIGWTDADARAVLDGAGATLPA